MFSLYDVDRRAHTTAEGRWIPWKGRQVRAKLFDGRALISELAQVIPDHTKNGGARRDRTDDLMLAKHALSQLSYGPELMSVGSRSGREPRGSKNGGPGKTRTSDLTLIKRAL
jgi:hypothetical protein